MDVLDARMLPSGSVRFRDRGLLKRACLSLEIAQHAVPCARRLCPRQRTRNRQAAVHTNHCLHSRLASALAISARSVEASAVAAAPGDRKGRGPLYGRSSRDTASERPTKQRPYDRVCSPNASCMLSAIAGPAADPKTSTIHLCILRIVV